MILSKLEIGKLYHIEREDMDNEYDFMDVHKDSFRNNSKFKRLYRDNVLFFVSGKNTKYGFGTYFIFLDKDGDKLCFARWQVQFLKEITL